MDKLTLLEYVQRVLSALESDEVNSIADTSEADLVATLAQDVYYNIITRRTWPFLQRTLTLESINDLTRPTILKIGETVTRIDDFRYNITGGTNPTSNVNTYRPITYLEPQSFLDKVLAYDNQSSNVLATSTLTGERFYVYTDQPPNYWTSFDDEYIVCDAYDSSLEQTLQQTNSYAYGEVYPDWTVDDDFVPDLPVHMISLYLNELKSEAFVNIKQAPNQKTEQNARRSWVRTQKNEWRQDGKPNQPNFGRS